MWFLKSLFCKARRSLSHVLHGHDPSVQQVSIPLSQGMSCSAHTLLCSAQAHHSSRSSQVWVGFILIFMPDLSSLLTRLSNTNTRMLPHASGISLLLARTASDHLSPPIRWTAHEQGNQPAPAPGESSWCTRHWASKCQPVAGKSSWCSRHRASEVQVQMLGLWHELAAGQETPWQHIRVGVILLHGSEDDLW